MARKDSGKKSKSSSSPKAAKKEIKSSPPGDVKKETKQPGLLAQAAATAGGVAVGSVVGKAVTDSFSGSSKSDSKDKPKCSVELKSLFDCYTKNKTTGSFQQCESIMESLYRCFNNFN
uniref:CHCH domain-containing protein n=1 Tax=Strongyloides venezuelensis TaxID=75913 RepID=A0A0K0EZX2_STRVS